MYAEPTERPGRGHPVLAAVPSEQPDPLHAERDPGDGVGGCDSLVHAGARLRRPDRHRNGHGERIGACHSRLTSR